jgi:hypothetical protein
MSEPDPMEQADDEGGDTLADRSPEYQALFNEYCRQCASAGAAFIELDLPIDDLRQRVEKSRWRYMDNLWPPRIH